MFSYLNEEGNQVVAETNQDPYAITFAKYVQITLLPSQAKKYTSSGTATKRGAKAATALLADKGVDPNTIYTITGGADDKTVQNVLL